MPETSENQIFLYLRLRDEKRTLVKSRIREFLAISKTTVQFLKEVWKKYGYDTLKNCYLEYVEANSELILLSIRKDLVKSQWILSGLIPKEYQKRMLNEEFARIKFTVRDFLSQVSSIIGPDRDFFIRQRIIQPNLGTMISLIRENIQESGEFYIEIDMKVLCDE